MHEARVLRVRPAQERDWEITCELHSWGEDRRLISRASLWKFSSMKHSKISMRTRGALSPAPRFSSKHPQESAAHGHLRRVLRESLLSRAPQRNIAVGTMINVRLQRAACADPEVGSRLRHQLVRKARLHITLTLQIKIHAKGIAYHCGTLDMTTLKAGELLGISIFL